MKKLYPIVLLVLTTAVATAQQLPHFSQYFMNEYIVNPAVAGRDNHFDVRTSQRHQWVGINDAPRTYTIAVNGPLIHEKMGIGAYAYADVVGPTRRSGFQASYAYHIRIGEESRLSMAASLGILHYALDGDKLDLQDTNDPSLMNMYQSEVLPDAKFALYYYTPKFYAGVTMPNLLQNRLQLYEQHTIENRLVPHFMMLAGYRIEISEDFMLEPSVLFKFVNPAPLNFDLTLRAHYKNMLWVGVNYRSSDSFTPVFGYTHKDFLFFGYGYDILTNNLQNYSSGSHEFMVGIRLNRHVKRPPTDVPAGAE